MALIFSPLCKFRLERNISLVFVDHSRVFDLEAMPRRRFRPFTNERNVNFFSRPCVGRGHNKIDCASNESRVPSSHQLLGGLTLARAADDWVTAG